MLLELCEGEKWRGIQKRKRRKRLFFFPYSGINNFFKRHFEMLELLVTF